MIRVVLLGRPQIFVEEKPITLPFKQAEALFYYLLLEGEVGKLLVADLIWGDKSAEEKIRSNLRNATYVLRKAFGKDALSEPFKSTLCLNPALHIETDAAFFLKDAPGSLELYTGEFLEGFYLKDNDLYNEWAENTRQQVRSSFGAKLKAQVELLFRAGDYTQCEAYSRKLIALDEFDETGYRYLIEIYKQNKDYTAAIGVYTQLEKLLAEELFELPGRELRSMAEDVKRERNRELSRIVSEKSSISAAAREDSSLFFGRGPEKELLCGELDAFSAGELACSLLICGEAGIGKTRLAEYALEHAQARGTIVLRARCYHAEEAYLLKPWQSIFEQLLDVLPRLNGGERDRQLMGSILTFFPYLKRDGMTAIDLDAITTVKYANAEKVIAGALAHLARAHKLLFFFDDIQWADETSTSLLRNIITTDQNANALFVLTCREEMRDYTEALTNDLSLAGLLKKNVLRRFDYAETISLAELLMPDYNFTSSIKKQLYHETEGSPFFIIEMLNNIRYNGSLADITPNICDVVRNRIVYLPLESRKLLELLALFFDGASFDMLLELSGKTEYDLAEALEFLIGKRLVREEPHLDGVSFQFTHQKILEFVYGEMSIAKRTVLHNKVGACYERRLENKNSDILLYTKLIHHFEKGMNRKKHLRYSIKYLYSYLNTVHEYYPVLDSGNVSTAYASSFAADIEGIDKQLARIGEQLSAVLMKSSDAEEAELLSDFYHMMGRCLIRKVLYEEGLVDIFRLKELNRACATPAQQMYMIKANRQLMCVYINRYQLDEMWDTIEESYRILQNGYKKEELAIWNRLEGLWHIMTGDIPGGEACLRRAVDIFESSQEKELYLFNLAASYAWLGEARRNELDYAAADAHYQKAIDLCEHNNLIGGACTFYTYAGIAAYDNKNVDVAEHYLKKAVRHFDRVDLMWGRGMAHCYYAQVCLARESYAQAREYLENAERYAQKLQSDYEKGVICRVRAQIRRQMETNAALNAVFCDLLPEGCEAYQSRARALLAKVYSPIDAAYLEQLQKMTE